MKFSYLWLGKGYMKVFVENDGGYGEFYLNFDNDPRESIGGAGRVAYKDKDYGPYLIKQLEHELSVMPSPEAETENPALCQNCGERPKEAGEYFCAACLGLEAKALSELKGD